MKANLFFNWSSGKDSSLALYHLLQDESKEVKTLFTTVSQEYKRVSMHGLRESLLVKQAESIGIPLEIMYLPTSGKMGIYNRLMQEKVQSFKELGFGYAAFGDIFLEDLKRYREQQLNPMGIKSIFPLWQRNTRELMDEFFELGFKTVIVSANAKWFSKDMVGVDLTKDLLKQLPKEVDPCGENGEFHTFCYDGPIFDWPISFDVGEKLKRTFDDPVQKNKKVDFWYCDLSLKKDKETADIHK